MRNVVLDVGISLDGYIAQLDGGVDFLFIPKDYSMGDFLATVDGAEDIRRRLENGRVSRRVDEELCFLAFTTGR